MTKDEIKALREDFEALVISRRKLGGFDAHAETILYFGEVLLRILQHLEEQTKK